MVKKPIGVGRAGTPLGLCTLGGLRGESVVKGLLMAAFGIFLGTMGIDPVSGVERFTFGKTELLDGIGFLPVAIGLTVFLGNKNGP